MEKVKPERRRKLKKTKRVHQKNLLQETTLWRCGLLLLLCGFGPFITNPNGKSFNSDLFLFIHKVSGDCST